MLDNKLFIYFLGVCLTLIAVFGDSVIKYASNHSGYSGWKWLLAGFVIYGSTVFGWFFVMRKMKLSVLGIVFSVSNVLFLTIAGLIFFNEKLSIMEIIGILIGILSLVILYNFS